MDERHRKFVRAFLQNGGNGAQAARDAGYSDSPGGAATSIAYDLLHDTNPAALAIQAAIREAQKRAAEAASIAQREKVGSLEQMMLMLRQKVLAGEGGMDVIHAYVALDKEHSKLTGMYAPERVEVDGLGLPQLLAGVMERVRKERAEEKKR